MSATPKARSILAMQQAKANLRYLNLIILSAFAAVALVLVYWSVLQADWLGRREDNPRPVEVELRTQRGSIYDTNNQLLAWSAGDERVVRSYAESSGAAVGYYSFRYGATGIESAFDAHLRGTDGSFWTQFVRDTRHEARVGHDLRLTIDSRWQLATDRAMAEQRGAVVMVSLPDNALRVLSSFPSFDPNLLDDQFEVLSDTVGAPLLNRATQGSYQPGSVLQPFLYASGIERNLFSLESKVTNIDAPVNLDGQFIRCLDSAEITNPTYATALRSSCPTPLVALTSEFTDETLTALLESYGFNDNPRLPISIDRPSSSGVTDLTRALVGQDSLTLSPLQVALAWVGLANGGERRELRLLAAREDASGEWVSEFDEIEGERFLEQNSAEIIIDALTVNEGIREHLAVALAGPDGDLTAWYLALAPAHSPRYALVLVLENSDAASAREAGRAILTTIIGR